MVLDNTAYVLSLSGRLEAAWELVRRASEILESEPAGGGTEQAWNRGVRAILTLREGRLQEAEGLFVGALSVPSPAGTGIYEDPDTLLEYGKLLRALDRPEEAEKVETRLRSLQGGPAASESEVVSEPAILDPAESAPSDLPSWLR